MIHQLLVMPSDAASQRWLDYSMDFVSNRAQASCCCCDRCWCGNRCGGDRCCCGGRSGHGRSHGVIRRWQVVELLSRYPHVRLCLHGHVHGHSLTTRGGIVYVSTASASEYPLAWREARAALLSAWLPRACAARSSPPAAAAEPVAVRCPSSAVVVGGRSPWASARLRCERARCRSQR